MKKRIWISLYFLNLILILISWYILNAAAFSSGPAGVFTSVGSLLGLLGAYFVLVQVFLLSRLALLEQSFGLDRLTRFHSLSGKWGIILIILHPFFIITGATFFLGSTFFSTLYQIVSSSDDIFNAFIALILFIAVVAFSLAIIRSKLKYESWYYVHLLVYIAIALSFGHQFELGATINASNIFYAYFAFLYAAVFGVHICYRFLRPLFRFYKHQFYIHKFVEETDDVTSIYIGGKELNNFRVKPGQFVIVRFLSKITKWQAHPFSVSAIYPDGSIRLSIKSLGDFTSKIKYIPVGTRIIIDGPHGIFTSSAAIRNKILYIAGGIGITPIKALSEAMAEEGRNQILIYGNKKVKDIVFKKELEELEEKALVKIVHVLSDEVSPLYENGYINEQILKKNVPDLHEREIYLCGPAPMMDSILRLLSELSIDPSRVHYERFSFV